MPGTRQEGFEMPPATWSLSKEEAGYRESPRPEVSCIECKWMFPRLPLGSCKYVRGVISATATCKEFESRHPRQPE
jgi:hypothetical protein